MAAAPPTPASTHRAGGGGLHTPAVVARPHGTADSAASSSRAQARWSLLTPGARVFRLERLPVRRYRPARRDVRPGFRDALAISQRIGVVRCPLARRKGNAVTYTLVKTRRSQKQRLQHNSASRAPLSCPAEGHPADRCVGICAGKWDGRRPSYNFWDA